MSGHLQSCVAAFLLTGLSISAASSNPLTDLFSFGSKEAATPAPAPAQEECLRRPGKLAADGRRWVYRLEGHRRCWHQTAEGVVASVKKRVHHYAAKQRATAHERREAALRKRKADVNARAEVLRSAPAQMSQPTPSAPELRVADTASIPAMRAAAVMPPAPVAESATDQLTSDHPTPRVVAVETLRVSSANDTITAPILPAASVASRPAKARDDGWGLTATWLGALLIALGLVSVLSSGLPRVFSRFE
jgi:hypothetical protein